jgi:hypothetical protein
MIATFAASIMAARQNAVSPSTSNGAMMMAEERMQIRTFMLSCAGRVTAKAGTAEGRASAGRGIDAPWRAASILPVRSAAISITSSR